jgi:hypothetical protein
MLEEIMLDKARIAREAAEEWALASENFSVLMKDPGTAWAEPGDMAVDWIGGRIEKVRDMMESELRRAVKSYLNTWARNETRRMVKAALPESARTQAGEWEGMVDDLLQGERVARNKAGKKNLTVWIAPKGVVTVEGDLIDYTSHEFWTDMYLYGVENPEKEVEAHRNFIRRLGDAGANAKYASEKMPQAHNGTARSYAIDASHSDSLVAGMSGKFDEAHQTTHRSVGADRRPMNLRDKDWAERPVSTHTLAVRAIKERQAKVYRGALRAHPYP